MIFIMEFYRKWRKTYREIKGGNPACLKIVSIFSNYEREKHN